jgi:transposase-like protein
VLAGLSKSAHPAALAAMRDIYNAEDIDGAQVAIKAFELNYVEKYPKIVAKIIDDIDVLPEFYRARPSTGCICAPRTRYGLTGQGRGRLAEAGVRSAGRQ